jgi:hypothetical protein
LLFFVPLAIGGTTAAIVALTVKQVTDASEKIAAIQKKEAAADPGNSANANASLPVPPTDTASATDPKKEEVFNVQVGSGPRVGFTTDGPEPDPNSMTRRIGRVARETLQTLLMLPIQILLTSLSSIIVALLYLKTRQAGGETLRDLFVQFEESEHPRKKWQERVRNRLIQSGRITSRS